jgi:hypothetical protein
MENSRTKKELFMKLISKLHNSINSTLFIRRIMIACFAAAMFLMPVVASADEGRIVETAYASPYSIRLPYSIEELIPEILSGERGDPRNESELPESVWYDHSKVGPWGPLPRAYLPPADANGNSAMFKRARIIAVAMRYTGYGYRHHYIPDWDPPAGWHTPKPGGARHDGKGVDCSNFTSFVYNQGLGIKFSSDIQKQADISSASINGSGEYVTVEIIPRQETVEAWKKVLKPGDLIFIRPVSGSGISHVIMWLGEWGVSSDGTPLILDSHGEDARNSNGVLIPSGIYPRPCRETSWYMTNADHAIRIIGECAAIMKEND